MPDSILIELQYFGPVHYYAELTAAETIIFEQFEHYVKGSYRNRCHIASVSGMQRLSIPLKKGKNQQQPIREVQIAYDEAWQKHHYEAIQTAYGNAPFFEFYWEKLLHLYFREYRFLWDFNLESTSLIMDMLCCKTVFGFSEKWAPLAGESIIDLRSSIHPKKSANSNRFIASYYSQVFEDRLGFLDQLSVLDLLFCCGPAASKILTECYLPGQA